MSKPASEPGIMQWVRRRTTTMGSTQSAAEEAPLFEQSYYAYNDLSWEKLEKWLMDKFPSRVFTNDKVFQILIFP
jgi:hypothetical protein